MWLGRGTVVLILLGYCWGMSKSSARCRVPEQPAPLECRDQLHMPQSCVFGKTHTLFGVFLVEGGLSLTFSLSFLSCFLLIGSIPRSLACPIILWNIQGNVSSCCHSNYYNIPHGSWLSSFWKCFSFFSPFFLVVIVTCEACRSFKGICSKPRRDTTWRGGNVCMGRGWGGRG